MEIGANILINTCHSYAGGKDKHGICLLNEEEFPSLPVTPEKPPVKKDKTEMAAADVIATLSQLINTRSDELKKLVEDNTVHISILTENVDAICKQMSEVKDKVSQLEVAFEGEKEHVCKLDSRVTDLERYSRRWNLKLHGVDERVEDKGVRQEVIRICQMLLPGDSERLPNVIDTVHRIGVKKNNSSRSIILQFSSRVHRDAVWAAAKKSSYLQDNGLRFAEDLCKADRESRQKLWPLVDKARKAGKAAYFVGGRAFIEKKEIHFPV